ncbi:outer membrane beta-barrel protein [Prevotella cerevisiae]|uniref:Outer membrane beta-barrel protein n=2 Tax=Segatella cerevisiae TaxID=2053716 RepID=A0ABT1C1M6_9BACT|nr:outer membrane beta-barrel protein [Segatella cerevisiae]
MLKLFLVNVMLFSLSIVANAQQLEGRIMDEHNSPLPYANVIALNGDSVFISGTVTDSTGVFVLPPSTGKYAMLQISLVGYKTRYIPYTKLNLSPIILYTDNIALGEVVVKSHLPKYNRVHGGYSTNIANTIFAKMNNADEVLSMLPRVTGSNGAFTIFGKGTPIIYINGRKVTDGTELRQLKTANISKVTVLTTPGPQYDSETSSVIIIKTKRPIGEGLSGSIDGTYNQSLKAGYAIGTSLNWRSKKVDIFGGFTQNNNYSYSKQSVEQTIDGNKNQIQENLTGMKREGRTKNITAKLGFNYLLNDSTSFGMEYHLEKDVRRQYGRVSYNDLLKINGSGQENIEYLTDVTPNNGPTHEVDAYYNGKLGDFALTFDGTYYHKKTNSLTKTTENSVDNMRVVNSHKLSKSHYAAAKLTAEDQLTDALTLDFGSEYYNSHINQSYINQEGIIASSDNVIKESNMAAFTSLGYKLDNFDISGGLRYEHIINKVYEDGTKNADESRTYNKFFPNIDLSYSTEDFNIGLSYGVTSTKPSYDQLSNIIAYDSRYLYEGGNPALKMTMEHSIELSAMYKFLNASVAYEIDHNPIVQWGKRYDSQSDIILLTNINIPKEKALTFSLTAQPVITFWHPTFEFDFQKQNIDKRDLSYNFNKPIFQLVFNNIIVLRPSMMIGANYLFHTSGADGYSFMGKYQEFSMSVTKMFFKRKLYTKIQLNDIFRSTKTTNDLHTDYYNIKSTISPNCRSLILTLGYNFNTTHKRYTGDGAGKEEKSRL